MTHDYTDAGPTEDEIINWAEADDYRDDYRDDDEDDRYDEYKDDLAMGYINPDGSQREPEPPEPGDEEPDLDALTAKHRTGVHAGGPCTCDPWQAD